MKEQNITFNLDNGESAPLQERGSLVCEQVDCDPDHQDVVDLVNAIFSKLDGFKIYVTLFIVVLNMLIGHLESSRTSFIEGIRERGSLVGEQVDCDPDLQDVVDLVNATFSNLDCFKIFLTIMLLLLFSSKNSTNSDQTQIQIPPQHVPLHLNGVTEIVRRREADQPDIEPIHRLSCFFCIFCVFLGGNFHIFSLTTENTKNEQAN